LTVISKVSPSALADREDVLRVMAVGALGLGSGVGVGSGFSLFPLQLHITETRMSSGKIQRFKNFI
jgi:hypothetical protein